MELSDANIDAVLRSGLLGSEYGKLSSDELYIAAFDALTNDSETVREFTAEQDKGPYSIVIRGVEGAYFVQAVEYDDAGMFDTIMAAESYVYLNFGEFMVNC